MIRGRLRAAAVCVVLVAGVVGSGACSDSDDVTVRSTVLTIFSSAQVVQLDPPVDGYSKVALTSETEYRRADGSPASLADVQEGSTVEVRGEAGAPGTVIARQVVLVD